MAGAQICEAGSTLAPLAVGTNNVVCYRFSENTNFWNSNSLCNLKQQHGGCIKMFHLDQYSVMPMSQLRYHRAKAL